MKKYLYILLGLLTGASLMFGYSVYSASTPFQTWQGGTGWQKIVANTLLLGNNADQIATTTVGTNGQQLQLVNGVPTWQTASSSVNTYTNANLTLTTLGGIAAGSSFSAQTMTQMWDALLYPYTAPTITLTANISTAVREFGNTIASINFTGTTVKKTNPITTVSFLRNGTPINYVSGPNPNGGAETYTEGTAVTSATSFTAKVSDGVATSTSNTLSYTFVYPYYYGVGAQSLTGAQIRSTLTTDVRANTASVAFTSSPSSQVYYFCYLASYAALTSILDTNGFETISGYTVRNPVAIVGLDTTSQNYRCYELTTPTTATNFTNTYKQ